MSGLQCPACTAACEQEGGENTVLGFLFQSMDYPMLLHCNCCGAYYERAPFFSANGPTLTRVERSRLADYREVRP